jgi:hypothetical protein
MDARKRAYANSGYRANYNADPGALGVPWSIQADGACRGGFETRPYLRPHELLVPSRSRRGNVSLIRTNLAG